MAWCHQATSHYQRQSWPRSLSTFGVTRPQWVNPWCFQNQHDFYLRLENLVPWNTVNIINIWKMVSIIFFATALYIKLWWLKKCLTNIHFLIQVGYSAIGAQGLSSIHAFKGMKPFKYLWWTWKRYLYICTMKVIQYSTHYHYSSEILHTNTVYRRKPIILEMAHYMMSSRQGYDCLLTNIMEIEWLCYNRSHLRRDVQQMSYNRWCPYITH